MSASSTRVSVRMVTQRDADAVVDLWSVLFPEYRDPAHPHRDARSSVDRKLAFGDGLFWLAEQDGSVLGTVMAGYDGHRGWIYSLGVHPDVRRSGLGRELIETAERALVVLGCPKINLQVRADNRAAQSFWSACGFALDNVVSFSKRFGSRDG